MSENSEKVVTIWEDLKVLGEQHWVTPSFSGQGDLKFEGTLRFSGQWKGSIQAFKEGSHLFLLKGAKVSGHIKVPALTVEGNLEDVLIESQWIRVLPGGKIFGSVQSEKVIIEEGALVQGRLYSRDQ